MVQRRTRGERDGGRGWLRPGVSLLACAVGLVVLPLTSAAFPGGNGNIVFSSNRDGNYEIYTMPAGGGGEQRLTTDTADDTNPAFSADGAKIVFSRNGQIRTMTSAGGSVSLDLAAGDEPAWSPDATKIAYVSSGDIFWIPAAGGTPTPLTTGTPVDHNPAWSPNGAKIVFERDGEIFTINSAGGGDQNLTNSPTVTDSQPNWSPDGTKIVFVSTAYDPAGEIHTMNASDGSGQVRVTTNTLGESWPTWSPDGALIAFARTVGNLDIYSMAAGGGVATQLTTDTNTDQQPDWGAAPVPPVTVPTNTALPVISPSGAVVVGATLSTTTGSWTGSPTSYSYQWKRCDSGGGNCTFISGATSQTYQVVTGDVTFTLRVDVTASNSAGPSASAATSAATAVVTAASGAPVNTSVPTIAGTPAVGQTLTSSPGLWSPVATSYAYQWKRCSDATSTSCTIISGATSSAYTVVAADLSQRLRVAVTASNASGSSAAPAESLITAAVAAAAGALTNTVRPVISGTPAVGQTLTTTDGTWSSVPTGITYQWRRCNATTGTCVNITTGGTSKTYTVVTADNGSKLAVVVTATHTSGTATATSEQTAAVGSSSGGPAVAPTNRTAPAISGQPVVGQTLRAANGNWNGTTPMTFAYQWQACDKNVVTCTPVKGATQATYALTAKDVGKRMRVRITATNSAGSSAVASQATALIGKGGGNAGSKLVGTAKNDKLNGTAKNDTIHGRAGNDTLNGLAGNDLLLGETGNDKLYGGTGVDGLNGGPGRDLLSGGAGNDGINSAGDGARDVVDCGAGKDRATVGRNDLVRNCETVKRKKR